MVEWVWQLSLTTVNEKDMTKKSLFDQEVNDILDRIQHYPAKYPNYNGGCTEDEPLQVVNFKKKRRVTTVGDNHLSWDEYKWKHRFAPAFRVYNPMHSEYITPALTPEQIAEDKALIAEGIAQAKYKYRAKKKGHPSCIIYTNTRMSKMR